MLLPGEIKHNVPIGAYKVRIPNVLVLCGLIVVRYWLLLFAIIVFNPIRLFSSTLQYTFICVSVDEILERCAAIGNARRCRSGAPGTPDGAGATTAERWHRRARGRHATPVPRPFDRPATHRPTAAG